LRKGDKCCAEVELGGGKVRGEFLGLRVDSSGTVYDFTGSESWIQAILSSCEYV
jgi:hypothetical protein